MSHLFYTMSTLAKTVGSLSPSHAVTISDSASIKQCAKLMVLKNTDCLLAVDTDGGLSGIITDKDLAYKVVADGLDAAVVKCSDIMTRDPIAVYADGSRNEALNIMISRRFRHLPVIY
jgi:signal-transduction protein with cAMP-binding, CBS, and nucleotidyltransferase domain